MIYLDNAASTPVYSVIVDKMANILKKYGNPGSNHDMGTQSWYFVNNSKKDLMRLIGATDGIIVFTAGGSEANNLAILGLANYLNRMNKKTIITSAIEHPSVLNVCKHLEECGFEILIAPVNQDGVVEIQALEEIVENRKDSLGLVTIQAVNNEIGSIQNLHNIGNLCEKFNVLFHTDAVQAIGHIPIDVCRDKISMLSLSGHKFHSLKGIGALYVKDSSLLSPIIFGGGQEHGLRSGTENVTGIASIGIASNFICENQDKLAKQIFKLHELFLSELNKNMRIPYFINSKNGVSNIISLTIPQVEGNTLMLMLNARGICVSTGSACSSKKLEASHVLNAIGLNEQDALCTIRISLSYLNTEEEMIEAAKAISDIAIQLYDLV